MSSATRPITFRDHAIQKDPFTAYAWLRDEAPVYWDPEIKCYVASRHDTNQKVLLDTETFSNIGIIEPPMPSPTTPRANAIRAATIQSVPMLVTNDPPQHSQYRRLSNGIMTPRQMKAMVPMIDRTVAGLFGAMLAKGGGDAIAEFAVPLPIAVISELLGLPADMAGKCKQWSDALMEPLSGMLSEEREIECAHLFVERQSYFIDRVEAIRREGGPPEHLLTGVALAKGQDGAFLGMAEALSLIEQYMIAGNETTTDALGTGLLLLVQRPDLVEALRADPSKVDVYVEEVLRLFAPAQGQFRIVTRDTELDGVTLPAGAKLMLRLGAANRDDRTYPRADEVDLDRRNAKSHLGFGFGVHFCQGAPLARFEMASAFRAFVDTVGTATIDDAAGGISYVQSILHIALSELHLTMSPRAMQ